MALPDGLFGGSVLRACLIQRSICCRMGQAFSIRSLRIRSQSAPSALRLAPACKED
ncbi:MAG: hypothetical protein LBI65_02540 [Candidatus Symbiothrix sp.]|nr:hypothetical protein [Candidatus Symbiothrix sp.]